MGHISSMFSLLFFLSALVSLFWGLYIIRLDPKKDLNQSFLALCISLSIWSFGFAMANSSGTLDGALFWRRFSSIGMVFIFSITLHFLLLLTRKRKDKQQEKLLYLLHIPAIICLYIFTISTDMAMIQYKLVRLDYGLTNFASNTIWNYFYYSYYSIYMVWGLFAVWKWKKRMNNKIKVKQANLIFISLLGSLILASLTDIIATSFMTESLPQMAPVFILLPVWAMYYSARYYDLIIQENHRNEEIIVTEKEKKKMFYTIALVFFLGGILNFLIDLQAINNGIKDIQMSGFKSIMYFVTGILIAIIQNIESKKIRESLNIFILVVNIPIITLLFLEYSSVTVWSFPVIIIIASLIFSNRTLLISTTIVSIITQRVVWILKPEGIVVVDEYDYIVRIMLLLVAFLVGSYVNKIYIAKIKENDYQIAFQTMNSEISSDFININKDNFDLKIESLLSKMGIFFEVDRAYLFLINNKNKTMTYSYEWCNDGIPVEVGTIEEIPLTAFSWWVDKLERENLVYIEDTSKMPKEAINEQEQLLRQKVKSLISVPVYGSKDMKGFIGIESVNQFKKWTDQNVKLLNILSNLLSDGLTKMKSEKEIEFMAYYDSLTGLPNRVLFKDRVKSAINLAERNNRMLGVIFIDLDNFKSVNDTMGHGGGDTLLKEVASELSKRVRKTDTVARFGGDEFMIMLNDVKEQASILKIVDNIIDIFSKPFNISGQDFFVTASAGIATFPADGDDPEVLIKNADIAMYESKSKGKNQYSLCTNVMKEEVQMNMTMSNDLYYALERGELEVYYQPQMDLNNKKITGLEALLRWKHPTLGMIPPKTFIPIAEKNGLINGIGEWVLETACRQNKAWQDMGLDHIRMAVNLSAIQFIKPTIADDVERILKATGLKAKYLELEITESIAIKETDFVVEVLNKLKKVGVSIAIDDFGTEYSSLSRLKVLPIDRIKIDMEFIQGIEKNEKDQAITMIIINLAKSLGLNVLAEGVETGPQLDFLNQKMCDYVQGFYYYKPMPAEEMEKILRDIQGQSKEESKLENLSPILY